LYPSSFPSALAQITINATYGGPSIYSQTPPTALFSRAYMPVLTKLGSILLLTLRWGVRISAKVSIANLLGLSVFGFDNRKVDIGDLQPVEPPNAPTQPIAA
jgi:hypothetical protein